MLAAALTAHSSAGGAGTQLPADLPPASARGSDSASHVVVWGRVGRRCRRTALPVAGGMGPGPPRTQQQASVQPGPAVAPVARGKRRGAEEGGGGGGGASGGGGELMGPPAKRRVRGTLQSQEAALVAGGSSSNVSSDARMEGREGAAGTEGSVHGCRAGAGAGAATVAAGAEEQGPEAPQTAPQQPPLHTVSSTLTLAVHKGPGAMDWDMDKPEGEWPGCAEKGSGVRALDVGEVRV